MASSRVSARVATGAVGGLVEGGVAARDDAAPRSARGGRLRRGSPAAAAGTGEKRCPSRWCTAWNGRPRPQATALASDSPTSSEPTRPGPAGGGDQRRSRPGRDPGGLEGRRLHRRPVAQVLARGDLRHHAAVRAVRRELARHHRGEHPRRRRRPRRRRCRRRRSRCRGRAGGRAPRRDDTGRGARAGAARSRGRCRGAALELRTVIPCWPPATQAGSTGRVERGPVRPARRRAAGLGQRPLARRSAPVRRPGMARRDQAAAASDPGRRDGSGRPPVTRMSGWPLRPRDQLAATGRGGAPARRPRRLFAPAGAPHLGADRSRYNPRRLLRRRDGSPRRLAAALPARFPSPAEGRLVTRVAINGLGRIGRAFLRVAASRPALEVVAANDLSPVADIAPVVARDTLWGAFPGAVRVLSDGLEIDGRALPVFRQAEPGAIPWPSTTATVVLEATGAFSCRREVVGHLRGPIDHVVVSANLDDADVTLCLGVNDAQLDPARQRVISNASCTTNCMAPVAAVLDRSFGLERGLLTTVHSYTRGQELLDSPAPRPTPGARCRAQHGADLDRCRARRRARTAAAGGAARCAGGTGAGGRRLDGAVRRRAGGGTERAGDRGGLSRRRRRGALRYPGGERGGVGLHRLPRPSRLGGDRPATAAGDRPPSLSEWWPGTTTSGGTPTAWRTS